VFPKRKKADWVRINTQLFRPCTTLRKRCFLYPAEPVESTIMSHPTDIYFHNSDAMRAVFHLDTAELEIWWSPLAGESYGCEDRWYSSRDAHFTVFARISLPGCAREAFSNCEWDPFHSLLRFYHQRLHIRILPDEPVVILQGECSQEIELQSGRFDVLEEADAHGFYLSTKEPRHTFVSGAELGEGEGAFRHPYMIVPNYPRFTHAVLSAGQAIAIGCGLQDEADLRGQLQSVVRLSSEELDTRMEDTLVPAIRQGAVETRDQSLDAFHRLSKRSLYGAMDKSGTVRASLKAIYYLVWLRDGSFCYRYLSSSGWPHRLREWCRLVLENRTEVDLPGKGMAPVFAQMVHKRLGKLEEDGIYYAMLAHFMRSVQFPDGAVTRPELEQLTESFELIHDYMFNEERGLYGSCFADETPTRDSRDYGWDYAMPKPGPVEMLVHHDKPVRRAFDLYMNLMMLETLQMLVATDAGRRDDWNARANRLWQHIEPFFGDLTDGLPTYGELLYEDGTREWSKPFEPCISMYPFSLGLPFFAPIPHVDTIRSRLFDRMMEDPGGHWVNGLGCVMSSLDTFVYSEEKIIRGLKLIERQSWVSGFYHPMPGAMPEKVDAPQGVIYHDIRPQAFAQACWIGAVANLVVRRMPFGLAVRPSSFVGAIRDYHWQDAVIDFECPPVEGLPLLTVDGVPMPHTLQLPSGPIDIGRHTIRLVEGGVAPVLARTTLRLEDVEAANGEVSFTGESFGFAEVTFLDAVHVLEISSEDGTTLPYDRYQDGRLVVIRFRQVGRVRVRCSRRNTMEPFPNLGK